MKVSSAVTTPYWIQSLQNADFSGFVHPSVPVKIAPTVQHTTLQGAIVPETFVLQVICKIDYSPRVNGARSAIAQRHAQEAIVYKEAAKSGKKTSKQAAKTPSKLSLLDRAFSAIFG